MRDFNRKINVKEMQIADTNSVDYGISKNILMECAGYSAALKIIEKYSLTREDNVILVCATGNNGGDGFVIARHLASHQISTYVILVGRPDDIRTEEAKINWDIISRLKLYIKTVQIKDSSLFDSYIKGAEKNITNSKIVIDCLLGTGIRGKIREPIKSAINFINQMKEQKKIIISIDVPSGMNPDDGSISDICVQPDLVITFHREKPGFKNSKVNIPEVIVNSIGIPEDTDLFVGTGDLSAYLRKRDILNHKGEHGKVLVIGGSEQYSGAPALSAMAALEMDMDLVIVYAPKPIASSIRGYGPNLIVHEGKDKNICPEDLDEISSLIDWADSIVLGPGIGLADETKEAVEGILNLIVDKKKPVVIDADAIKISSEYKELLKKSSAILTPHAREFFILTGTKLPEHSEFDERSKVLELVARKYGVVFLVKGKFDYMSDPEKTRINKTGVPQMAVGGTGDILTGIVASLLALKIDKFNAACIGAYISGKLGELYLEKKSKSNFINIRSFKSSDLIEMIPLVIGKYL